MSELRIRALRAGYQGSEILRGIDLHIPAGGLTAVLGPSGCGKTTLLRAIAGFLRPTAGHIEMDGHTIAGPGHALAPEQRGITIVPQDAALFPHLSVAANIAYGLPGRGRRAHALRRNRVTELLDIIGMADHGSRRPHQLSGGQQQRVALARALAPRPAAVLLDEPFSALDAGLRADLRIQVRDILTELGTTAVLVTHDQDEALSIADRIAVLREGRVAQTGTPRHLYTTPADIDLARFLGEAVLLHAIAHGRSAHCALGEVGLCSPAHGSGTIMLRPEQLHLHPCTPGKTGSVATVERARFHGYDTMISLRDATGTRLLARTPAPETLSPGDRVTVEVHGTAVFYPGAPPVSVVGTTP